jgi:hypothetical protein
MKRRQAIKHLVILSSAAAILPGCHTEPTGPVYENVSLDDQQYKLLGQFINSLLPQEKTNLNSPETTVDFVLTVLNDCHSPEDIQKFKEGIGALQAYLSQNYEGKYGAFGDKQKAEIFTYLSGKEGTSEPVEFFYTTSRKLAIEHFTSSPFFMKNIMDWEFAPGYFKGCVPA